MSPVVICEKERARRTELLNILPCEWASALEEVYAREAEKLEVEEKVKVAENQQAAN